MMCTGKDCLKTFCTSLVENAMEIINFKKKKITSLTKHRRNHIKM